MKLQSFKCHKVVKAAQILMAVDDGHNVYITLLNEPDVDHPLDPEIVKRYVPVRGDYLVQYEDGYLAVSPKEAFENGYSALDGEKTLHNSTVSGAKKNVSDLVVFGDGDTFKLICKASSKNEGWMKSTKAMEIPGVGCVVQVTTQQGQNVAEALSFVPGVKIKLIDTTKNNGRRIVKDDTI